MGYWNSRGLRGAGFETIINFTNDIYLQKGLAVIQKVPTPITPVEIDNKRRTITLAYFEQKSTVDYIGAVQGIPICFDAKETNNKSLPIQNIHEHQVEFMTKFYEQKGISFLLVNFKFCDEYYFFPIELIIKHFHIYKNGGRKSIAYDSFKEGYKVPYENGVVNYLVALNDYLVDRERAGNMKS